MRHFRSLVTKGSQHRLLTRAAQNRAATVRERWRLRTRVFPDSVEFMVRSSPARQNEVMKTWIFTLALAGAGAFAAERSISREKLPEAVQKAVEEQSKGATIAGFSRETEDGKIFYEVELKVNGRTRDVLMDPSGNVVTIEEEVPIDSLPAPVRTGFEKRAGKRKIVLVESISTPQGIVAYEAHIKSFMRTIEVKLAPDGSPAK